MATETVNVDVTAITSAITAEAAARVAGDAASVSTAASDATTKANAAQAAAIASAATDATTKANAAQAAAIAASQPLSATLSALLNLGVPVGLYVNIATLTNQIAAAAFYPVAGLGPVLVDTTAFTQVRFQFAVTTASASANTPRLILRYFTAYSATVSDYVDIGTTEVSGSLSSVGVKDTGFINLAAGAIGATTYIRVIMIGGDAAADPVTGPVQCFLR
jgi:hypothetical protein